MLGSTVMVTDPVGGIQQQLAYDAFGNPFGDKMLSGSITGAVRNLFTGKPYNPLTGLLNYGYRDYSSLLGRFTCIDPIRDGLNWYAYCHNDPVNFIDWWGLCEEGADSGDREISVQILSETVAGYTVGTYNAVDYQGYKKTGFFATFKPIAQYAKVDIGLGTTFLGRALSVDYSVYTGISLNTLLAGSVNHTTFAKPELLAYNLQLSGDIRPVKTAAHHIVAGNDSRANEARNILKQYNIDINHPANGVFLPDKKDSTAPGAYHPKLHTDIYYRYVEDILTRASAFGKDAVLTELELIKQRLLTDIFPY